MRIRMSLSSTHYRRLKKKWVEEEDVVPQRPIPTSAKLLMYAIEEETQTIKHLTDLRDKFERFYSFCNKHLGASEKSEPVYTFYKKNVDMLPSKLKLAQDDLDAAKLHLAKLKRAYLKLSA